MPRLCNCIIKIGRKMWFTSTNSLAHQFCQIFHHSASKVFIWIYFLHPISVETFLRANNLKYEVRKSPNNSFISSGLWIMENKIEWGKIAFHCIFPINFKNIFAQELNGKQIADSQVILWTLMNHFKIDVEFAFNSSKFFVLRMDWMRNKKQGPEPLSAWLRVPRTCLLHF